MSLSVFVLAPSLLLTAKLIGVFFINEVVEQLC